VTKKLLGMDFQSKRLMEKFWNAKLAPVFKTLEMPNCLPMQSFWNAKPASYVELFEYQTTVLCKTFEISS